MFSKEELDKIMTLRCDAKSRSNENYFLHNPVSRKKYNKEDYDFVSRAIQDSRNRMGI